MFNPFYKTVVVELFSWCRRYGKRDWKNSWRNVKKGTHKLVAMSMAGTDKAILPKPKITYRMIQEYVEKEYVVWVA